MNFIDDETDDGEHEQVNKTILNSSFTNILLVIYKVNFVSTV